MPPIRILYWNIENFAINKIQGTLDARERLAYILKHLTRLDATPDIFVVVEVETGNAGRGRLVHGQGLAGWDALLGALRREVHPYDNWMGVPPLQTADVLHVSEGVAVFYNSSRLAFTGPDIWPGGTGAEPIPGTRKRKARDSWYPPSCGQCLPADRRVPDDALHNPGEPEASCAARTSFRYADRADPLLRGRRIGFPRQRSPYMVTFSEITHPERRMPDSLRDLTLFAVHAPPNEWFARNYLRTLSNTGEIVDRLDPREVRIIAGDFNVNLLREEANEHTGAVTLSEDPIFREFRQDSGYAQQALHLDGLLEDPDNRRRGYFATHMKPRDEAAFWSTHAVRRFYAGYGYVSHQFRGNLTYSIDNVFTRYGEQAGADPANFTILNGVVGSPYTRHPVPDRVPAGLLGFPISMADLEFQDPPESAWDFAIDLYQRSRAWANYGHIRSTSDHMALVIDV